MAHQWFGDLVTMAWWDDLWLNEGFASWMATKATDKLHPEWEPLLGRVDGREDAINLDSVATTHPIVQKIETVEQISQAFDSITYRKGEAVITMLEDYVGEDAWRTGVRDYMATYKLGNTVTDDLWGKVERAAGTPVTAIAHDFTLQPGVPLIRVDSAECGGGKTTAMLRQGEFSRDRSDKQALSWRVPVIAGTVGGGEARTLVSGGSASLAVPGCGALLVNKGQTGYYRTLYTPALLDKLTAAYPKLAPIDQIGLLADSWGLGLAGYQSAAEALDLVDAIPANANPKTWSAGADILARIYRMYDGDARHQAMVSRYASRKLSPVLARLGWAAKPREADNDAVLRASLISILGEVGDPAVVAESNRRFQSNDPAALNGPLRSTILGVAAANLDAAGWDRLHAQAKAEKSPLIRSQLYQPARLDPRRGARPPRARARFDRRARRDQQQRDDRRGRIRASRSGLRFRARKPGGGRGPGRCLVAQPLFRAAGAGLGQSGDGRQAAGLCDPLHDPGIAPSRRQRDRRDSGSRPRSRDAPARYLALVRSPHELSS